MKLTESVQSLAGIGATRAKALERLGIVTVRDLLYHPPRGYQNRGAVRPLSQVKDGEVVSLLLTVGTQPRSVTLKKRLTLVKFSAFDETGKCQITFFGQSYLCDVFTVGTEFRFYGKIKVQKNRYELSSPAYEPVLPGKPLPPFLPVHPRTEGITEKILSSALKDAFARGDFESAERLNAPLREKYHLPSLKTACLQLHFPKEEAELRQSHRYFAFEEFFLFSLGICHATFQRKKGNAPDLSPTKEVMDAFLRALPFSLTDAQQSAIREIASDLCAKEGLPMARLLSGDVGSGKTVCAAAAAYFALIKGKQVALMAPTEILAAQHYQDLSALFAPFGIRTVFLCGSMRAKEKQQAYREIASGQGQLIIGTHALFTETVSFSDLALVITDEQHRFGIYQRTALGEKGSDPHMLVLSATPIPRTLALILYGDLSVSVIDELPPGRQSVDTFVVNESYRARLQAFIATQVAKGQQVYIVCPAIEESTEGNGEELPPDLTPELTRIPTLPLRYAVTYAEQLQQALPRCRIALLHGKMKGAEKDRIMSAFAKGEWDVLVSTTVIEVGVNVPNATLMIVENAERFGLSQLHQLRGRVGRGKEKSYCILVSDTQSETAKRRLEVLRTNKDGFAIAKQDLELRGPGDFLPSRTSSARQSGQAQFRMASLGNDFSLLQAARNEAAARLEQDPTLSASPALRDAVSALFEENQNTFH